MKNPKLLVLFIVPIFILFVVIGLSLWWKSARLAPSNNEEEVRVLITNGMSTEAIGRELADAGVIRSAFAFKLYSQFTDKTKGIPPGEFLVPQNLDIDGVIDLLKEGPTEYWVTIPEGLRREEIPARFLEGLSLEGTDADNFVRGFLSASRNLEGFLFPDSYLFPPDITPQAAVDRLNTTFYAKVGQDYEQQARSVGLTMNEAVTLASLIERETISDEERPIVAGIAFNRMELGMPLQMDASVQYVLGDSRCNEEEYDCDWWDPPLKADLQINSRYNTYTNQGLPPAPIASPGLDSLMAVVSPEESDYLYYIHADGKIYYAQTLDGHNANVSEYLR